MDFNCAMLSSFKIWSFFYGLKSGKCRFTSKDGEAVPPPEWTWYNFLSPVIHSPLHISFHLAK